MVARGGQAGAMWDRLLAAVVVTPDSQDDAAVSQYDISYQLNEIEASAACTLCELQLDPFASEHGTTVFCHLHLLALHT